jgi:two-component system CheB/CheR fusion protein
MLKKKQQVQNNGIQTVMAEEPVYVIAVGASAGGLEAIHEFFDNMPDAGNAAFVVIQHLSPAHKSLLVELVARHTRMNVVEAAHNVVLQKSCVYIIPNNKMMTIKGGRVQLVQKTDNIPNAAVDAFLYSLARDKGRHAIAVILSGTGSDGTRGAEAIKQAGGILLVQSPDTAKFDGMPTNAINAGNADFILPPAKMPEQIAEYIKQNNILPNGRDVQATQEELLQEIMGLIKMHTGQDFNSYKPATIMRRIEKRMLKLEIRSPYEYVNYLTEHPEESEILYKHFLIGVTRFFRDKQAFKVLEAQVLPDLVKGKRPGDLLKLWVNACSTGEEAYSVAIVFDQYIKKHNLQLDIKLFATDLDEEAINYAGRGIYPLSIEKDVEQELLDEYFIAEGKKYVVAPHIRKKVVFARHNVLKDPPFIHNDFVSCRNMLIYMDSLLQARVLDTLDFSLHAGGYLFLGTSEHLSLLKENFVEVDGKWKVFKKVSMRRRNRAEPTYNPTGEYKKMEALRTDFSLFRSERKRENLTLVEAFKDLMAEEFNYAALYIDRKYEVKEAVGEFTRYLSLPERKLNFHLLKMLLPELSIVVNAAVRKAWKENQKTIVRSVRIKRNEQSFLINAMVQPFPPEKNPCTLVVFWETAEGDSEQIEAVRHQLSPDNQSLILELEDELQDTRNNLQMAVEGLETANEELQSSNEELLSANEELQSSNEELQSLNEELHTLNTEHQLKIRELIELNDDLNNYFSSTDMGQVFVDSDMRIRKFNPAAVKMINLIESDIGRPIDHISSNIEHSTMMADIRQVLKTRTVVEKEIRLSNGANALMRVFPYIRSDKKVDGAVISFIDISVIKNLDNIIAGIFNSTLNAIVALKAQRSQRHEIIDFKVQTSNKAADELLGKNSDSAVGLSLKSDLTHLSTDVFFDKLVKVVEENKVFHGEYSFTKDEQPVIYELIAVKMMDGVIITYSDITEKKDAEQRLRRSYSELVVAKDGLKKLNRELEEKVTERTRELSGSEERFRLISQATNDAIWDWNLTNNTTWYSDTFYQLFQYDKADVPAERSFWLDKIHPDDRARVQEMTNRIINQKETKWSYEYRFLKGDGSYAFILDRGNLLQDEYHTPYRMLGSMMDITVLREAEKKVLDNIEQKEFLADAIPMIVYTASSRGTLEFVNQQFPVYIGEEEEDLLLHGLEYYIHPNDVEHYRKGWQKALEQKKELNIELLMRRNDGQYRWQQLQAKPMMSDIGALSIWVGTILEIHDRKVATEVLEYRVKERTEELERINQELELSNTELQQYAFVASHDLKEPTRKIFIFANMIRDTYLEDKDSKVGDLVNRIVNSSQRMMRLIEDLLNYSKLSQHNTAEPIDLHVTVKEILSDLEVVIAEKNAVIEVAELCPVYGVQAQIRQVFQNLISNALKFSRKDVAPHIKVNAFTVNEKSFEAEADPTGAYCHIEISDNGIGFNEKFLDKIFTLFQRLHTQEKYEGTGIGLAITRKIVEKHQGIVTARSVEGKGTTFVIVLPTSPPAPLLNETGAQE